MKTQLKVFGIISIVVGGIFILGGLMADYYDEMWAGLIAGGYVLAHGIVSVSISGKINNQ